MPETASVPFTFNFQNLTSQMEVVKIPKETMKNPPFGVARRGLEPIPTA